jgi:hypothetical protein
VMLATKWRLPPQDECAACATTPGILKGSRGDDIDTPGLSDLLDSSEAGAERRKMIISIVPLGRFGTPDEIAAKQLNHP